MSDVPNPLKSYREAKNLSLEHIAGLLGVNRSTVLRWEESRIPAERMLDVERVTGLPRAVLRPDIYGPASDKSEAAA